MTFSDNNNDDDHAGDGPRWDPTGWHPIYLGDPNIGNAQLVGHTRLELPVDRFVLTRAGEDDAMIMGGDMIRRRHRRDGGVFWAWELMRPEDLPHVPEFRPLRH